MMRIPALSRSTVSSRRASPICFAISSRGMSVRGKDQFRIVTGPVSIPFTGRFVSDCAYLLSRTVIGSGRDTSP
jgi:hypothetical protein